jgi:hypothetical protein
MERARASTAPPSSRGPTPSAQERAPGALET